MRLRRAAPWLLMICLAACGVFMRSGHAHAVWLQWCASAGGHLLFTAPLVLSLALGFGAAARMLIRTERMLRRMRARLLPPGPLLHAAAEALHLHGRLHMLADSRAQAWCYGLLHPRIVVTTGLLNALTPREVEAVLRHERHHMQRRDPLRAVLHAAWDAACWWDRAPGAAHMQHELAADRAVIAAGQRGALASALLKLLVQNDELPPGTAISGLSVTEARIDQLLQSEGGAPTADARHPRWPLVVAFIMALLLCSVALG